MSTTKTKLIWAENLAIQLFKAVEDCNLITAGKTEQQLNAEVFKLAFELFGIEKHWHKRIVRSGANTLYPYNENPKDLVLQEDDILFFDFGRRAHRRLRRAPRFGAPHRQSAPRTRSDHCPSATCARRWARHSG